MSFTFAIEQLGTQPGTRNNIPKEDESAKSYMPLQLSFPLLMRLDKPSVVHPELISACGTYRDAVRLCYALRRIKGMGPRSLAEHCGIHPPHMTDFLSQESTRREMPAKYIAPYESICGNTVVSQWIARGASLSIAEEATVRKLKKAA